VLTAMTGDGAEVYSRFADRAAGLFTCFCCSQLVLRRGQAKAAHCAARSPVTCE
jgi:hypothetical protein